MRKWNGTHITVQEECRTTHLGAKGAVAAVLARTCKRQSVIQAADACRSAFLALRQPPGVDEIASGHLTKLSDAHKKLLGPLRSALQTNQH